MPKEIRLGIAGLGNVGASLVRLIDERAECIERELDIRLTIAGVAARDICRERDFDINRFSWYSDAVALAKSPDIDIFIELIGGEESIAAAAIKAALNAGRNVVTANKALLAHKGIELADLAQQRNGEIAFEAAVAGGIPAIKTLKTYLTGHKINKIHAILNGTCNYILTCMLEEGVSFARALEQAQSLGYAEKQPSFDIDGLDAAHKLAILTSLAFKTHLSFKNIFIRGIGDIDSQDICAAEHFGYRLKLLASCVALEEGIVQTVEPCLLPKTCALAQMSGVLNGLSIFTDLLGELYLSGAGAGGMATSAAVLADILALAQKHGTAARSIPLFSLHSNDLVAYKKADLSRQVVPGFYIRLCVEDRAGVFADVSKKMARNNVSFESIVQNFELLLPSNSEYKDIIIITQEASRYSVEKALKTIAEAGYLKRPYKFYPLAML